jgi:hypothetical protein
LNKKLTKRFSELEEQMQAIVATRFQTRNEFGSYENVNSNVLLAWRVKTKNLIVKDVEQMFPAIEQFLASHLDGL